MELSTDYIILTDYLNLTECKIVERDSLLIFLGFLSLKKMYYFLNELSNMEEIDKLICETNTKIILLTHQVNDFIKRYTTTEKLDLLMRQSIIKKVDDITIESLKLYTPVFKSIDIDIIASIDSTSIILKEKVVNIESKFMELNSIELRQKYLKNKILYLSSFSVLDESLIQKYNYELNDNEIKISLLMSIITTYKNELPTEIKNDIYMKLYKKSIDFNENYKGII